MLNARILLVEDEESLLLGIRDLLELEGYSVVTASNGKEALKRLGEMEKRLDLIISDIRMPLMDGYQLLEEVRGMQEWVSIPFIFLTARGEREDVHAGRLKGADDYLIKPFDNTDLLVSVKSCLSRNQAINAAAESRMGVLRHRILDMINHEFRTPLSYIVAYADLMNTSEAFEHSAELRQYVSGIVTGSERLMRLISSFLLLAELESGHGQRLFQLRAGRVDDLPKLVENAIHETGEMAHQFTVTVQHDAPDSLPAVWGDETYLSLAIRHLLENAIKFSTRQAESVVRIRLYQPNPGTISIEVVDYGQGIPPEFMDQLFEMFFQAQREEYEQQGIGAGLVILRHVADLHGGSIDVQSKEGEGSTFTLSIPVMEAEK